MTLIIGVVTRREKVVADPKKGQHYLIRYQPDLRFRIIFKKKKWEGESNF